MREYTTIRSSHEACDRLKVLAESIDQPLGGLLDTLSYADMTDIVRMTARRADAEARADRPAVAS